MSRLRFGVTISTSAARGRDPVADATYAEQLGFDLISASDHPQGTSPTFETWTLLAWLAASTARVKILPNVLGAPHRPPAMLAKMAESLDRLSGGRLVLGIGAGAMDADALERFGLERRSPGEKVDALEDTIAILRTLWRGEPATHEGRERSVRGATITPRADRDIPIWIGGYGPEVLAVVGRAADGWVPSMPYAPLERVAEMRVRIDEAAAAAGRDASEITCAYNVAVKVGGGPSRRGLSGEPAQIAERIVECIEAGFTVLNFWLPEGQEREHAERLAHEVLPIVRTEAAMRAPETTRSRARDELVEEASKESFPASDSPGYALGAERDPTERGDSTRRSA